MNNSFLHYCNETYETLRERVYRFDRIRETEALLSWIQKLAQYASAQHPGRYADGEIENIAFEIGKNLDHILESNQRDTSHFDPPRFEKTSKPHILHIATRIYKVGGHSRIIGHWIHNDSASRHSLLLIDQKREAVPVWIQENVSKSGGNFIVLPSEASLLMKAKWLREIAQSNVEAVILHHHPYDVVPIVAFAESASIPPVGILNHADHVFWLGSSVADTMIHFRESGKNLAENRRFGKHHNLLPLPLASEKTEMNRIKARRELKIPYEQISLLSIGTPYKYIPTETHNFFETGIKILNQNPEAHLYLIGVKEEQAKKHIQGALPDRFHCLGILEDTLLYCHATDLYLEGFPFTSTTALLEPASLGVPVMLSYAPTSNLLVTDDLALKDFTYAANEEVYLKKVSSLIRNKAERLRLGEQLRESVHSVHVGGIWHDHLQSTYASLRKATHQPRPLPVSPYLENKDDLALSRFNYVLANSFYFSDFLETNLNKFSWAELFGLFVKSFKPGLEKLSIGSLRKWMSLFCLKIDKAGLYPRTKQWFRSLALE